MALLLLSDISNTVVLFFTAMLVCCTLEYFVSWLLEEMFDTRWWDYTNWPLNINGRVCIYGAVAFGILIVLLIRCIHPFVESILLILPIHIINIMCAFFAALIIADKFYTLKHLDSFKEKLWFVKEQPKLFENDGPGLLGKNKRFLFSRHEIIDIIKNHLK